MLSTTDEPTRSTGRPCTHGHTSGGRVSPTYSTWLSMRARCSNPNVTYYADYGGRGITVCDRWQTSFEAFLEDMGEKPAGTSIERIDRDGHYEPGNCRWATLREQGRNKRNNLKLTLNGETRLLVEWSERTGIPYRKIRARLDRGWSAERALTTQPEAGR